jgi:hypothetical protein
MAGSGSPKEVERFHEEGMQKCHPMHPNMEHDGLLEPHQEMGANYLGFSARWYSPDKENPSKGRFGRRPTRISRSPTKS